MIDRKTLIADRIERHRRRSGVQLSPRAYVMAVQTMPLHGNADMEAVYLKRFINRRERAGRKALRAAKLAAQHGNRQEFLASMQAVVSVLNDGIGASRFGSSMLELRGLTLGLVSEPKGIRCSFQVFGFGNLSVLTHLKTPPNKPCLTSHEKSERELAEWRARLAAKLKSSAERVY